MIDLLEDEMLKYGQESAFPFSRIVFPPLLMPTPWMRQLNTGETK